MNIAMMKARQEYQEKMEKLKQRNAALAKEVERLKADNQRKDEALRIAYDNGEHPYDCNAWRGVHRDFIPSECDCYLKAVKAALNAAEKKEGGKA